MGDVVFVVSTQEGISDMMETSGKESFDAKNIMILGGSKIGKHIALKHKDEHLWKIWFMHYPLGIANVTTRKVLPMCPD